VSFFITGTDTGVGKNAHFRAIAPTVARKWKIVRRIQTDLLW
jgi:dethiobiotin synthetase